MITIKLKHTMEITGDLIKQVWAKATPIHGQDPEIFRIDTNGVWIRMKDYNNVDSIYGWTIYQVNPSDEGGLKNPNNLIPIHTQDNSIPLAGYNPPLKKVFQERFI